MTTLLTQKIGQDNQRRCDAKCYGATTPGCDCVCGGKNHGAGEHQAMQNVREMFVQWAVRVDSRPGRSYGFQDAPGRPIWRPTVIAHEDDPTLLEWIFNASELGGSFLHHFAHAAMVADQENYPVLKPIVERMRIKYPAYDPNSPQSLSRGINRRHQHWMTAEQWRYAAMIIRNEIKQPIARANGAGAELPEGLDEFLAALFDYAEHKQKQE